MTHTSTFALLEVSAHVWQEIAARLTDAGYHHAIEQTPVRGASAPIVMEGLGLVFKDSNAPRITTTLHHCARCGGSHINIIFTELENAPADVTHWAMCPTLWQPILLTTQDDAPIGRRTRNLKRDR